MDQGREEINKNNLNKEERKVAEEVKKRFPIDQWLVIKVFSDHQKNIDTTKNQ